MARRKASATFDAAGKRAIAAARRGSCVPAFKAAAKAKKSARLVSQIVGELCTCSSKVVTVKRKRGFKPPAPVAIKRARPGSLRHTIQQMAYLPVPKARAAGGMRKARR